MIRCSCCRKRKIAFQTYYYTIFRCPNNGPKRPSQLPPSRARQHQASWVALFLRGTAWRPRAARAGAEAGAELSPPFPPPPPPVIIIPRRYIHRGHSRRPPDLGPAKEEEKPHRMHGRFIAILRRCVVIESLFTEWTAQWEDGIVGDSKMH